MDALEAHVLRQIERSRDFFWHRLRWRVVSAYLPTDRPFELVDVGAGAGLLGEFLRRERPRARYRFVESLPSLARHLESIHGPGANYGARARFEGADFVTLMDVLEHQPDDRQFLAELVDRMPIGATLIVTVPALMSLWSQWDVLLGHHRRYDKTTLRDCLAGLPVDLVEVSYLMPEMIPLALLRKLRQRKAAPPAPDAALFPDLPTVVNALLYGLGRATLELRRWTPAGTTLAAVAVRRDAAGGRFTRP